MLNTPHASTMMMRPPQPLLASSDQQRLYQDFNGKSRFIDRTGVDLHLQIRYVRYRSSCVRL
jgi:hypothetical protein